MPLKRRRRKLRITGVGSRTGGRRRSALILRTRGGFAICSAMSGNGARTPTTTAMTARRAMRGLGGLGRRPSSAYVAGHGSTISGRFARRNGCAPGATSEISPLGSESRKNRHNLPEPLRRRFAPRRQPAEGLSRLSRFGDLGPPQRKMSPSFRSVAAAASNGAASRDETVAASAKKLTLPAMYRRSLPAAIGLSEAGARPPRVTISQRVAPKVRTSRAVRSR